MKSSNEILLNGIFDLIEREDFKHAIIYCAILEKRLKKESDPDTSKLASCMYRFAIAYRKLGKLSESKNKISSCLKFCSDNVLECIEAMCWREISLTYYYQWKLPKYVACIEKIKEFILTPEGNPDTLILFDENINNMELGNYYESFARASVVAKKNDDAEFYAKKMREYLKKAGREEKLFRYDMARCDFVDIIIKLAKQEKSEEDFKELHDLIKSNQDKFDDPEKEYVFNRNIAMCDIVNGCLLNEENKYPKAKKMFLKARGLLKQQNYNEVCMEKWIDEGLKGKIHIEIIKNPGRYDWRTLIDEVVQEVKNWS